MTLSTNGKLYNLHIDTNQNRLWFTHKIWEGPMTLGFIELSPLEPEIVDVLPHSGITGVSSNGEFIAIIQYAGADDKGHLTLPGNYYSYNTIQNEQHFIGEDGVFPTPVGYSNDGKKLYLSGFKNGTFIPTPGASNPKDFRGLFRMKM
jgi:hypothetical protein